MGAYCPAITMAEFSPARQGEHLLRFTPVGIPVLSPAHEPVNGNIIVVCNPEQILIPWQGAQFHILIPAGSQANLWGKRSLCQMFCPPEPPDSLCKIHKSPLTYENV